MQEEPTDNSDGIVEQPNIAMPSAGLNFHIVFIERPRVRVAGLFWTARSICLFVLTCTARKRSTRTDNHWLDCSTQVYIRFPSTIQALLTILKVVKNIHSIIAIMSLIIYFLSFFLKEFWRISFRKTSHLFRRQQFVFILMKHFLTGWYLNK